MSFFIRGLELTVLACIAISLCACMRYNEVGASNDVDCDVQVKKLDVKENCALQIAKAEIINRQGKMIYSSFSTRFSEEKKIWVVTAKYEPPKPGGFVIVFVKKTGVVDRYEIGE